MSAQKKRKGSKKPESALEEPPEPPSTPAQLRRSTREVPKVDYREEKLPIKMEKTEENSYELVFENETMVEEVDADTENMGLKKDRRRKERYQPKRQVNEPKLKVEDSKQKPKATLPEEQPSSSTSRFSSRPASGHPFPEMSEPLAGSSGSYDKQAQGRIRRLANKLSQKLQEDESTMEHQAGPSNVEKIDAPDVEATSDASAKTEASRRQELSELAEMVRRIFIVDSTETNEGTNSKAEKSSENPKAVSNSKLVEYFLPGTISDENVQHFNFKRNGVLAIKDDRLLVPLYVPCSSFLLRVWQLAMIDLERFTWYITVDEPAKVQEILIEFVKMLEGEQVTICKEKLVQFLHEGMIELVGSFMTVLFVVYYVGKTDISQVIELRELIKVAGIHDMFEKAVLYSVALRLQEWVVNEWNCLELWTDLPICFQELFNVNVDTMEEQRQNIIAKLLKVIENSLSLFKCDSSPLLLHESVSHSSRKQFFVQCLDKLGPKLILEPGVKGVISLISQCTTAGKDTVVLAEIRSGGFFETVSIHPEIMKSLTYRGTRRALFEEEWLCKEDLEIACKMLYRQFTSHNFFEYPLPLSIKVFDVLSALELRDIWNAVFMDKNLQDILLEFDKSLVLQVSILLGREDMLGYITEHFNELFDEGSFKKLLAHVTEEQATNFIARLTVTDEQKVMLIIGWGTMFNISMNDIGLVENRIDYLLELTSDMFSKFDLDGLHYLVQHMLQ